MKPKTAQSNGVVFSPNLRADDELANYWMRQATHRLRREIAWIWHERGMHAQPEDGALPPMIDRASDSLDLSRHWAEKQRFFSNDVTARYLSEQLDAHPPRTTKAVRGSFGWVIRELNLDEISAFVLALGLASALDASYGAVIASCLNDANRTYPNLLLAQRLWDRPEDVLMMADPMHPLFSHGLLTRARVGQRHYPDTLSEQPLIVPALVAMALLSGDETVPARIIEIDPKTEDRNELSDASRIIAYRLKTETPERLRVVPLLGNRRASFKQTVVEIARLRDRKFWQYEGDPSLLTADDYLNTLATLAWLRDRDLFIRQELFPDGERNRVDLATHLLASVRGAVNVATATDGSTQISVQLPLAG